MRDPKRIYRILDAIEALWRKYPDWRLCQLIVNVVEEKDPFYIEDDILLNKLEEWLARGPQAG